MQQHLALLWVPGSPSLTLHQCTEEFSTRHVNSHLQGKCPLLLSAACGDAMGTTPHCSAIPGMAVASSNLALHASSSLAWLLIAAPLSPFEG